MQTIATVFCSATLAAANVLRVFTLPPGHEGQDDGAGFNNNDISCPPDSLDFGNSSSSSRNNSLTTRRNSNSLTDQSSNNNNNNNNDEVAVEGEGEGAVEEVQDEELGAGLFDEFGYGDITHKSGVKSYLLCNRAVGFSYQSAWRESGNIVARVKLTPNRKMPEHHFVFDVVKGPEVPLARHIRESTVDRCVKYVRGERLPALLDWILDTANTAAAAKKLKPVLLHALTWTTSSPDAMSLGIDKRLAQAAHEADARPLEGVRRALSTVGTRVSRAFGQSSKSKSKSPSKSPSKSASNFNETVAGVDYAENF